MKERVKMKEVIEGVLHIDMYDTPNISIGDNWETLINGCNGIMDKFSMEKVRITIEVID
jgi:hypothetical protein